MYVYTNICLPVVTATVIIVCICMYLVQFHPSYGNLLMHFAAGVHLEYEHVRLHT